MYIAVLYRRKEKKNVQDETPPEKKFTEIQIFEMNDDAQKIQGKQELPFYGELL